jgi:septum formation protein
MTPGPDLTPAAGPTAPVAYAVANARHKALNTSARVNSGLVIGCDTIVCLGSRVLGKPSGADDARRMLGLLSGRTHRVVTGVAVHDRRRHRMRVDSETSRVTFRRLGARDVDRYLASGEPFDKAGAYGIQGIAASFVSSVSGSYLNVVGLPVARLLGLLRLSGWNPVG